MATLDEIPSARNTESSTPDNRRPGDDFNLRATWDEVLTPHRWVRVGKGSRGETLWRRPDKSKDHSATTNATGNDTLIVHSTSTTFEISPASYSKFGAYALLNHDGDHKRAAEALRAKGYGSDERLGFDDLYLTLDQLNDPTALDRAEQAARAHDDIEATTTFLDTANIGTFNRQPYDDARGCPVCRLPAFYIPRADRFFHRDGADNGPCWGKLLRGESDGYNDHVYDDLYLSASALDDMPRADSLIDGVLDRPSLFIVSGRKGTLKSFLVLDWLASLASGRRWMGRAVERVKVLYVIGEGAYGLAARKRAWETAWNVTLDDEWFHVRRAPVNLFKRDAPFADLLVRIERQQYGAVVFDTLQRMSAGAEANSAKDAGLIGASLDRVREATHGGAVGVVAHSGKSDLDTRGSSAFEDDVDIVYRLKRDDDSERIVLELARRKDGPEGQTFELRPKLVDGTDSLILQSARGHVSTSPPKHHFKILMLLGSSSVVDEGLSQSQIRSELGLEKSSVHVSLSWLMDQGHADKVSLNGHPYYKINEQGRSKLAATGHTES
jgi:hypothetical protein